MNEGRHFKSVFLFGVSHGDARWELVGPVTAKGPLDSLNLPSVPHDFVAPIWIPSTLIIDLVCVHPVLVVIVICNVGSLCFRPHRDAVDGRPPLNEATFFRRAGFQIR